MAMLPANSVIGCAKALRLAFRGDTALNEFAKGVLKKSSEKAGAMAKRSARRRFSRSSIAASSSFIPIPAQATAPKPRCSPIRQFSYNGPRTTAADVSVGIAIGHFKSSLQDVVREAREAEKRAKRELGRAAVAVTLLKRSGEILKWGTQWESGGLELYERIANALEEKSENLSGKFPHRVCELLRPDLTTSNGWTQMRDAAGFDAADVIKTEFAFAANRQGSTAIASALAQPLAAYLETSHAGANETRKGRQSRKAHFPSGAPRSGDRPMPNRRLRPSHPR